MTATATTIAGLCKLKPRQVIDVFRVIQRIVSRGETVRIRCFGKFERVIRKGRTQRVGASVNEDGFVTYGDRKLMKFRPSDETKRKMNKKKRRRV